MRYSISALIIATNEQATVDKVIDESIKMLPKRTRKYEILINDDASSDRTPLILDSYAKRYSCVKIYHQKNMKDNGTNAFEFLGLMGLKIASYQIKFEIIIHVSLKISSQ